MTSIGRLYHDFVAWVEVFHADLKRREKFSFDDAAMHAIEGATDWRKHAQDRNRKGDKHAA